MRAALVRVDKGDILPGNDVEARLLLEILDEETGLSFVPGANLVGRDLVRLGDLELLLFANDPHKTPEIRVTATDHNVEVVVDQGFLSEEVDLIVRCRQTHAGAILADSARLVAPAERRCIRFAQSPVGASGAMIEIWVKPPKKSDFRLVYEHDAAWIRQVGMRSVLADAQIDLKASWIEDWAANRRASKGDRFRIAAMRAVKRVIHSGESVVGKPHELWSLGEVVAESISKKLRPVNSGALWIPRMSDPGSGGRMRLAEWFRETFKTTSSGLVLVDPYFDSSGLDIIARLESPNRKVTVVTALSGKPEEAEEKRNLLQQAYTRFLGLFGRVDLSIFTVKPERLHDRIVLEIGSSSGSPLHGFSLSNSLCSATKKHGLLITPIPDDVLTEVADAVSDMIEGMQPLLSRSSRPSNATRSKTYDSAVDVETSELRVFEAIANRDKIAFTEHFASHALLVANTNQFDRYVVESAQRWSAKQEIAESLELYLANKTAENNHHGDSLDLISLAQMTTRQFSEIRDGARFWVRGVGSGGADWEIELGLWLLFVIESERFTRLLCSYCEKACRSIPSEGRQKWAANIGAALSVVGMSLHGGHLEGPLRQTVRHGLGSDQPLVRSLFGALLGRRAIGNGSGVDGDTWSTECVRSLLLCLRDERERMLATASWLGEVRQLLSSRTGVDCERYEKQRVCFTSWMIEDCPKKLNYSSLREVVRRHEPGYIGVHSQSLVEELLVPLNVQGKLTAADLVAVWLDELEDRIQRTLKEHRFFIERVDPGLTEACGRFLADGDSNLHFNTDSDRLALLDRISVAFETIERVWKTAGRELDAPFAQTLRSRRWNSARRAQAWINGLGAIITLRPSVLASVTAVTGRWTIDCSIVELEAEGQRDPSGLFMWLVHLLRREGQGAE